MLKESEYNPESANNNVDANGAYTYYNEYGECRSRGEQDMTPERVLDDYGNTHKGM